MAKATKRLPRARASRNPMSEARKVVAGRRRLRKQLGIEFGEIARQHGGQVAGIARRIIGDRPGAKRISDADLSTLGAISITDGDRDGLARRAIDLELLRRAGITRRSL